jgi:hypothetical protein
VVVASAVSVLLEVVIVKIAEPKAVAVSVALVLATVSELVVTTVSVLDSVDAVSVTVVLLAEVFSELVVLLEGAASPFWTWNQLAPTGSGKLAAWANPAMSKPILACVSAGGKKDENWSGMEKPSNCRYSKRVYW